MRASRLHRLLTAVVSAVVLVLFFSTSPPPARKLKSASRPAAPAFVNRSIITWNVNTAKEPARLDKIGRALSSRAPSVVALNEVSLSPQQLTVQARRWGFSHTLLLRNDRAHRFNLALLSSAPLTRSASAAAKPFFHGVLCAHSAALALHVCVTHLTPHSPTKRNDEARELLRIIGELQPPAPTIVLGDLNALSPRDAAAHAAGELRTALRAVDGFEKFAAADGSLDYSTLSLLAGAGAPLRDVHAILAPTVPTQRGGDPRHAAPMRLDYALADAALVARCPQTAARTLDDAEVGALSDHFPVEVRVCAPAATASRDAVTPAPVTTTAASDADAGACGARASYDALLTDARRRHCAELSGLARELGRSDGARLGRCAVVGSSGLLRRAPQGAAIDAHDAVIRMNAAPTRGWEAAAGARTTARFVNAPQGSAWADRVQETSELPPQVGDGELLMLMGHLDDWATVAPARVRVAKLEKRFRKECVLPFFSEYERDEHKRAHGNSLTPTFGFEAIVHALYACESVDAYGFYIDPRQLEGGGQLPRRDTPPVPYHYWEERTVDKKAREPSKPWTFASHNYEVESGRLRHMAVDGCLVKLHLEGS